MFANHKLKDSVAEKFKTLIIKMAALSFMAQTGMRERLRQEEWIPEFITDTFLYRGHVLAIVSETKESLNLPEFDPDGAPQSGEFIF
jgi:hypothetical protein